MTDRRRVRALIATSILALASGGLAMPTYAQDSDTEGAVPQTEPKPAGNDVDANGAPLATDDVQGIVVTAQRREQRLQETPVAVTALSTGALEQLNVSDTRDLMQVVPSLQVSTQTAADGGGSATFFLRGMGQQRSGNGSEPAIGIYVDDFYYPSLSGSVFDVVDLAQVEVLRGPQGTLFGRNTIGGAIRYTTRGAELGEFSGHVTGTVGSRERYDIAGAVNVPIGDFAALRVTGGHLQQDGYVRVQTGGDDAGATRTDLLRAQARIEPTSSIYADLSAQYSEFKLDGFAYNVPGPLTPIPPGPGESPTLPFVYNNAVAPAAGLPLYTDAYRSACYYCQYGTAHREFSKTTYKNALATIGWDIDNSFTIKSLTGWQSVYSRSSTDLDSTPLPLFTGGEGQSQTYAFSQELQLNGELIDNRLNFVAGAYYYNERQPGLLAIRSSVVLGQPSTETPADRKLKSYAGFVDGSFELTDKLSLLGGFRYSEDHKSVHVEDASGATLADASATFDSTTYRAGVQYQWTSDIMTYVNTSTGFRGGGFNPYSAATTPSLVPFDPERATSYEVGARLQFLDRRITINPTAFYVNWDQIQVQAVTTDLVTGNAVVALQNAGAARSYGFELEWSAEVSDTVRLFGNFAYLNLRYTDIGTATGITLDSDFQRAPPITFSLGAAHTIEFDSGAKIVSTLHYSFNDDQRSTPTDSDHLLLQAYSLLDGRIAFTDADQRFSIAAFVTNILDEKYAIGGVNYYSNVGAARYDLGRPREFGLTGRINF